MPKFTRQHYIAIGDTLKKIPKKQRKKQADIWNQKFAKDNPRYNPAKFYDFIGITNRRINLVIQKVQNMTL